MRIALLFFLLLVSAAQATISYPLVVFHNYSQNPCWFSLHTDEIADGMGKRWHCLPGNTVQIKVQLNDQFASQYVLEVFDMNEDVVCYANYDKDQNDTVHMMWNDSDGSLVFWTEETPNFVKQHVTNRYQLLGSLLTFGGIIYLGTRQKSIV